MPAPAVTTNKRHVIALASLGFQHVIAQAQVCRRCAGAGNEMYGPAISRREQRARWNFPDARLRRIARPPKLSCSWPLRALLLRSSGAVRCARVSRSASAFSKFPRNPSAGQTACTDSCNSKLRSNPAHCELCDPDKPLPESANRAEHEAIVPRPPAAPERCSGSSRTATPTWVCDSITPSRWPGSLSSFIRRSPVIASFA